MGGHGSATGGILEAVLNLLAKSHRIDTFKVSDNLQGAHLTYPGYNCAVASLFLPPESSLRGISLAEGCAWQNALKRIVGIKKLICTELEGGSLVDKWSWYGSKLVMEECMRGFEEVKKVMESDGTHHSEQTSTDVDHASRSF